MTSIKEQICAEIKAQKNDAEGSYVPGDDNNYWYGKVVLCDELLSFLDSLPEQPVEWEDEYREEDLRTRFAFYTYKNEEDDGVLYLSNVFVEEASRNAGFGTKILEAAEKVAETIGAITICLKVKQDSPANAWYRKHGYGYVAFEGEYDWLEKNLEYLKPKRKEQPVEGLEEAANKWGLENQEGFCTQSMKVAAFKAGAEWNKDKILKLIELRISEIIGDAQPNPVLRIELQGIIDKIK